MKPGSLYLGYPVQTRDGRPARIICTDRACEPYIVVALILNGRREIVYSYTKGGYRTPSRKSDDDLINVP